MDEGYILANKFRRAIFDELAAGETDIRRIAKKHRIIPKVAQRVIDEFITGGIVEQKGKTYVFTEKGKKLMVSMVG